MEPNLARDGLNLEETANFLQVSITQVGLAVKQDHLRCGIFARGWTGTAFPDLPGRARWEGNVCDTQIDFVTGKSIYTYRYVRHSDLPEGQAEFEIQQRCAGHFWYLDHTDAYALFDDSSEGIDVTWLQPYDGQADHARDPLGFPAADFTFWIHDDAISRHITQKDVLFLRRDLEAYRYAYLGNEDQPDKIRGQQRLKKKIDCLQQQWELLTEKLNRLNNQRILETRVEEKLRLEIAIRETESEHNRVEKELKALEDELGA